MDLDRHNLVASTSQSIPSLTLALTGFLHNIANVLRSLDIHLNAIAAKSINDLTKAKYHKDLIETGLSDVAANAKGSAASTSATKGIDDAPEYVTQVVGDAKVERTERAARGRATTEGKFDEMDLDLDVADGGRGGIKKKRGRP